MKVSVREAEVQDSPAIESIGVSVSINSWRSDDFLRAIENNDILLVAEVAEKIAGYIHLRLITSLKVENQAPSVLVEYELLNIAVSPRFHRQGIATLLFDHFLKSRPNNARNTVFLEVRAGNSEALHLYTKLGFKKTGERPGYYSKPTEDAVLMRIN